VSLAVNGIEEIQRRRQKMSTMAMRNRVDTLRGDERAVIRLGNSGTRVLVGLDDLSGWDDEELREGRRRSKNGTFIGKKPIVVPKALHDELVRRVMGRAQEQMRDSLMNAVNLLDQVVTDKDADNKDRLAAAKMIIDRVMGKDPVMVNVAVKAKWETAMEDVVARLSDAIETTAAEDDDDWDYDGDDS
jgi:hypothetical protein